MKERVEREKWKGRERDETDEGKEVERGQNREQCKDVHGRGAGMKGEK